MSRFIKWLIRLTPGYRRWYDITAFVDPSNPPTVVKGKNRNG